MSGLRNFVGNVRENEEDLIKRLENLTKECQVEENRSRLDKGNFVDLSLILTSCTAQEAPTALNVLRVLTESFRFLRNSVINCKANQDFIRDQTQIIPISLDYLKYFAEKDEVDEEVDEEVRIVSIRCCLQFIANLMVDNLENARLVSNRANETLCSFLKCSEDEKIIQYSAMSLHLVLKLNPEWMDKMDPSFLPQLLKNTHLEFIMYVMETLGSCEAFMTSHYLELETEVRVSFLKIFVAHTEMHSQMPESVLKFLAEEFKSKSDLILKSQMESDEWVCWEVASVLELLCSVSTVENVLGSDASLLTTAVFLLRSVHAVGKASSLEENQFTPVQALSKMRINQETLEIRSSPTFQFKAHLIRLIANLAHRNLSNQDMVREMEGLSVILDCCQIDARNPFITQWSVFAIRNLCEGNPRNQDFIREVQRVDTENKLPSLQIIGL